RGQPGAGREAPATDVVVVAAAGLRGHSPRRGDGIDLGRVAPPDAPGKGVVMRDDCAATPTADHRPAPARPVLNALTVDVEDYYPVASFEGKTTRAEWDRGDARVIGSPHCLLDMFGAAGVRGPFFVLGWVAERYPQLARAIHGAGHEIGCHSYWHRLV